MRDVGVAGVGAAPDRAVAAGVPGRGTGADGEVRVAARGAARECDHAHLGAQGHRLVDAYRQVAVEVRVQRVERVVDAAAIVSHDDVVAEAVATSPAVAVRTALAGGDYDARLGGVDAGANAGLDVDRAGAVLVGLVPGDLTRVGVTGCRPTELVIGNGCGTGGRGQAERRNAEEHHQGGDERHQAPFETGSRQESLPFYLST